MNSLAELNEEQRIAATTGDGVVQIVAGPGTGKTKTLVGRVAYLVETGRARPRDILAITFTNKAAASLRRRLTTALGEAGRGVWVGTFHALALELLGDDGRAFVTESQRLALLRPLAKQVGLAGLSARELGLKLTRHKNALDQTDAMMSQLSAAYDAVLREQGLRDFDELLNELNARLEQGEVTTLWTQVLVDEFQDTSEIQYALVRRLALAGNVMVIGDPRQSIYGFRGAGSAMFDRLARDYPASTAVALTRNYRSGGAIVRCANEVFADALPLEAATQGPGAVQVMELLSDWREADWVVGEIERLVGGTDMLRVDGAAELGHYRFSDIAVVYRTHRAAQAVMRRLHASGLPYQVAGGDGWGGQPALRRLVAVLQALAGREPSAVEPAEAAAMVALAQTLLVEAASQSPSQLVGLVAQRLGLDAADEQLAVQQLASTLVRFDGRPDGLSQAVNYLEELAAQEYYDAAAEAVSLLTVHAAKGLEFGVVFVIGANEGVLPHLRADGTHDIDEERRLFYVAVTRAKDRLLICWARERAGQKVVPSRFLAALSAPRVVDPEMTRLEKRRQAAMLKRAQGTLF